MIKFAVSATILCKCIQFMCFVLGEYQKCLYEIMFKNTVHCCSISIHPLSVCSVLLPVSWRPSSWQAQSTLIGPFSRAWAGTALYVVATCSAIRKHMDVSVSKIMHLYVCCFSSQMLFRPQSVLLTVNYLASITYLCHKCLTNLRAGALDDTSLVDFFSLALISTQNSIVLPWCVWSAN